MWNFLKKGYISRILSIGLPLNVIGITKIPLIASLLSIPNMSKKDIDFFLYFCIF